MSRVARFRAPAALLVSGALALQALATCVVWIALAGAPAACCPLHEAAEGASLTAVCCVADEQAAQAPDAAASPLAVPLLLVVTAPWYVPTPDAPGGYPAALPAPTRGHTSTTLSALLI